MLRILLAIEDYSELVFLQTLLKKVGFDVDGVNKETQFEDSYLSLNPDIVVMTAYGKKIDGISLAEKLKKSRGSPKVVLLAPHQILEKLQTITLPHIDSLLESPVSTSDLLKKIAALGGLDEAGLLEKYRRIKNTLSTDREVDKQILQRDNDQAVHASKSNSGNHSLKEWSQFIRSTQSTEQRKARFAQAVASGGDLPKENQFDRKKVHQYTKDIRSQEAREDHADLEAERMAFVKQLFKK